MKIVTDDSNKTRAENPEEKRVMDVLEIKMTTNLTELSALTELEEEDVERVVTKLHKQHRVQILDQNKKETQLINLADAFIHLRRSFG